MHIHTTWSTCMTPLHVNELPLLQLPGPGAQSCQCLSYEDTSVSSCSTDGDSVRAMPSSCRFSGSMMDHLPNSIVPHLNTAKQATSAWSVVPNEPWGGAAGWTNPVSLHSYQGLVTIFISVHLFTNCMGRLSVTVASLNGHNLCCSLKRSLFGKGYSSPWYFVENESKNDI